MPRSAKVPCRHGGCSDLLDRPGFCDEHRKQHNIKYHQNSSTHKERNRFYQRAKWKRVRNYQLLQFPFCKSCQSKEILTQATVVDHIIPIAEGGDEYDQNNLQSMCVSCHNAKTAGGW